MNPNRNDSAAQRCLVSLPRKVISAVFCRSARCKPRAHDCKVAARDIGHPWRLTANGVAVAGGYLTITNMNETRHRLIGRTSPAANRIETHESANIVGGLQPFQLGERM